MSHKRQVYLLDPQLLPPETIAVTFAKTSRSPESFEQIAAELTAASSAEFNKKWVVGYGHSSVAEHAVVHIAFENVSRLAIETIESNRLASYTEKSTRYQTWADDAYYIPEELHQHPLRSVYTGACDALFSAYQGCLNEVNAYLNANALKEENETDAHLARRLRTQAIDACRYLLPAAALANVGMTVNARALEHAIGKMLSSPLREARLIGEEMKQAAMTSVPTLLKYANPSPYLEQVRQDFSALESPQPEMGADWCQLIHFDAQGVERVLAAALYREQELPYAQALRWVSEMPPHEKETLLRRLFSTPTAHTIPARELEFASFTFDLILDQGAYFELKRHRMMTQTPQRLTASLGYALPRLIADAGALPAYRAAMETAHAAYAQLAAVNREIAAYLVPNGYNRRVLLNTNLRSLMHFIRLRSAPNAHFAVRRAAQRLAEETCARAPELCALLGRNETETSASITSNYFYNTCM